MERPPTPGKTSCGACRLATTDSIPAEVNSPWTTMASDSCIVSNTSTSSGSAFGCVLMVLLLVVTNYYGRKGGWVALIQKMGRRIRLAHTIAKRMRLHLCRDWHLPRISQSYFLSTRSSEKVRVPQAILARICTGMCAASSEYQTQIFPLSRSAPEAVSGALRDKGKI